MPIVASTAVVEELSRRFTAASKSAPGEFARLRSTMARGAGTESRRTVVAIYNLTQSRVGQDQKVKTTAAGFIVTGQKKTISAISYKFRVAGGALRGKFLKAGATVSFKPGFLSRDKGLPYYRIPGEPKRVMTKGKYAGKRRQPVHVLHGPSVADAMHDTRVAVPMRERIWERVRKEYSSRISRLTRKQK